MTLDHKTIRITDLHRSAAADFYLRHEREKVTHPIPPRNHRLPMGLVVSLTSYGKRLETLHLTLRALAEQTVQPDRIIVWLTSTDLDRLPACCKAISPLIEFAETSDMRSYKKLVPALVAFPDCTIVTADDDAYYHRRWLELLTNQFRSRTIACHVAYRYHHVAGSVVPYQEWTQDVQDADARSPSHDLVAIGIGGILYPPHALHEWATRRAMFEAICPSADDLWFYAMARLNGTKTIKIGPRLHQVLWPGTQENALWRTNIPHNNDECTKKLIQKFGVKIFRR